MVLDLVVATVCRRAKGAVLCCFFGVFVNSCFLRIESMLSSVVSSDVVGGTFFFFLNGLFFNIMEEH